MHVTAPTPPPLLATLEAHPPRSPWLLAGNNCLEFVFFGADANAIALYISSCTCHDVT